jgi:hypothetical protein
MPDELRRGFKSEAEDLAELVRGELDLGVLDRLDCYVLAETWGIPIVTLGELREEARRRSRSSACSRRQQGSPQRRSASATGG